MEQKKSERICNCPCHIDGAHVLHCVACCDLSYEKYINKSGDIDMERYSKLKQDTKENLK
jgi:hypothetical protein